MNFLFVYGKCPTLEKSYNQNLNVFLIYFEALKCYCNMAIATWIARGYKNTMKFYSVKDTVTMPAWIGDMYLHASHRSNLLRKDPKFYGQYGWHEPHDLEYVWPVSDRI